MSLDIKVNRPPGRRAPGPEQRRTSPTASGNISSSLPPGQQPVSPPASAKPPSPPEPLSSQQQPKSKGKLFWWLLLIILFIALGVMIYMIWSESQQEQADSEAVSPVVSTFTPTNQPSPAPPEPVQPETPPEPELTLSALSSQLGDLSLQLNELVAEPSVTSTDKAAALPSLADSFTNLQAAWSKYYNNLQATVESSGFSPDKRQVLNDYLTGINSSLEQAQTELNIASFALSNNNGQELSPDLITEALGAFNKMTEHLNSASQLAVLLEQELNNIPTSEVDGQAATSTVSTTEKMTTSTATTE